MPYPAGSRHTWRLSIVIVLYQVTPSHPCLLCCSRPLDMSQFSTGTPDAMSQTPATMSLSSNIESIFNTALKSYKKKTKKDLTKHDLFKQLENCDSPAAILAVFQAEQLDRTDSDDRLRRWFIPTANVLYAFSGTLGAGVGLVNINSSVSNITI